MKCVLFLNIELYESFKGFDDVFALIFLFCCLLIPSLYFLSIFGKNKSMKNGSENAFGSGMINRPMHSRPRPGRTQMKGAFSSRDISSHHFSSFFRHHEFDSHQRPRV